MELIGKPTINPLLFYTGKISGYITWIVFVYSLIIQNLINNRAFYHNEIIACSIFALAMLFTVVSCLNLGKSIRLGLPIESTVLKLNGMYKISRNPIYVGFGLFTIASMIYTMNEVINILGVFSLIIYHMIIRSEEKFLLSRFGKDYENYKKK